MQNSDNYGEYCTRLLTKLRKARNDKLLKYDSFLEICHAGERGISKI